MDAKSIIKTIEELNKLEGSKRKFSQSYDLLFSLKDLNLKKPEEQVEFFMSLPVSTGKKKRVCALVGPEMVDDAKEVMDTVVAQSDFQKLDKKKVKKLADEHEWFVGQANVMPKIAAAFGRVLGPRAKMPNPKAGCIVPPKAPLKPLYERLQQLVKISAKKQPNIQLLVGTQAMKPEDVAKNIMAVYDQVIHHLPKERNNIKTVSLKLTMTKPVKLE